MTNKNIINQAIIHILNYKDTGNIEDLKKSQRLAALLLKDHSLQEV